MSLLEVVQIVAAAMGAGLGGWVHAWRSGRPVSASLARIEELLEAQGQRLDQFEARLHVVERDALTAERLRRGVQTGALRGAP